MLEFLYSIDLTLFYFLNDTISNPIFNRFFPFISNVKHWYIAYILLWSILIFKGGGVGKVAAVGIILLIISSDQLSSSLLKNLFERIRPCNALNDVNILVHCSKSFSFPSSHALNNFAVAVYFYRLYPNLKWILFSSATIIAISRSIVGVHYPSDIFAGALIGSLIGYIFAYITLEINLLINKKRTSDENQT